MQQPRPAVTRMIVLLFVAASKNYTKSETRQERKMDGHNYSVRPGVVRPFTVLVTEMGTGAFMIQGYPTGAAAYVAAEDGKALRDALDAAFGDAGWAMDIPPIVKPRI